MKKLNCILLIDDNEHTNIFNEKLIRKLDIAERVYSTLNGREGLDYLKRQGEYSANGKRFPMPNLIFLDINMPVMDGWEFLEEYKHLIPEQKKSIPIVMLTTSPNPDDEAKARSIPEVNDFRRKPISIDMLREIISGFFREDN